MTSSLRVTRDQNGSTTTLRLSGEINETVNFAEVIGAVSGDTVLNCKEVSRINSLGVKEWINFFETKVAAGAKLRFVECSPTVVEQLGLIANFACGGKIESIYVPFACTSSGCGKELVGLFKVEDLLAAKLKMPAVKCSTCGAPAVFDDIEDEYFRFASRLKKK